MERMRCNGREFDTARFARWLTCSAILAVAVGCASDKPPAPPVPDMIHFSDDTATALTKEIPNLPDIKKLDEKGILELGEVENHSKVIPTDEFRLMQSRIENGLMHSADITDVLFPIEDAGAMAKEWERSQGKPTEDPLQETDAKKAGISRFDPSKTFVLRGKLFEADRDGKGYFYFTITLVNLESRKLIFTKDYLSEPPK
jgi:hypothetical protein